MIPEPNHWGIAHLDARAARASRAGETARAPRARHVFSRSRLGLAPAAAGADILRLEPREVPERSDSSAERSSARRLTRGEEALLRIANVLVATAALLLLAPIMLAIAVLIRIESRGPVFYRQVRVGLDRRGSGDEPERSGRRSADMGGRPFMIYKFRTMRTDAERETGPVWAAAEDDRTTRVGRWLRHYRLDEIPQFLNVIEGQMSVVGPRPERPTFVRHLREEIEGYQLRQRVQPGITGWAQVNQAPDRSLDDVRSKIRYDLEYVRRRSLWFDLLVMARTLPVMLERNGGPSKGAQVVHVSSDEACRRG